MIHRASLVLACVVLGAISLEAQQTTSVHAETPVAGAARRTGPIVIDGKPSDEAWNAATPITQFRQSQPNEGEPSVLQTEVRILFDDEAIYIAARMSDPELISKIIDTVSIPVMAKARIGHFVEAQIDAARRLTVAALSLATITLGAAFRKQGARG